MVSHLGQILMVDWWCPILGLSSFCWWMVSHPGYSPIVDGWCPILVTAPELQEDGMVQVLFTISLLADIPLLGATMILVMAPELQEDGMVLYLSATVHWVYFWVPQEFQNEEAWHHKMSWHQNCKRCPSTSLYELLSLNF